MSNQDGKNRIKRPPKDASFGYDGIPYLAEKNMPVFRKLCRKAGRAKARSEVKSLSRGMRMSASISINLC